MSNPEVKSEIAPADPVRALGIVSEIPSDEVGDALIDALEAIHAPTVLDNLGDMLVKYEFGQAACIIYEGEPSEMGAAYVAKEVAASRAKLEAVHAEDRYYIDGRMHLYEMPKFLLQAAGVETQSVSGRLTEKNPDGSYAVGDATFTNILEWHNYTMNVRSQEFMRKNWPEYLQSYKHRLQVGVYGGWLPDSVFDTEKMNKLDQAQVILNDGLNHYENETTGSMVKHDRNQSAEVFLPLDVETSTVMHELSHVIEGQRIDRKLKRGSLLYSSSFGLNRLFGISGADAGRRLNEAVTTHIAETMMKGNPDVINPDIKGGPYELERHVLDRLCNGGLKTIDIRLFIDAYFEDTDSRRPRGTALSRLKKELKEAFPGQNLLMNLASICGKGDKETAGATLQAYVEDLSKRMGEIRRLRHLQAKKPTFTRRMEIQTVKRTQFKNNS